MLRFRSLKEYENNKNQEEIPPIIANAIIGDLLMMKEYLDEDSIENDQVDLYGPSVLVMTREEFKSIETLIPSIEKENYEYKDIVGVDDNCYITKLLYLFNNGDLGIIIYVISSFKDSKYRFMGKMFMTIGVKEKIPNNIIGILYKLIELGRLELNDNLDYLQIFNIETLGKTSSIDKTIDDKDNTVLVIEHKQEKPGYNKVIYLPGLKCKDCKLYWISSEDEEGNEYSTLMLAEEY